MQPRHWTSKQTMDDPLCYYSSVSSLAEPVHLQLPVTLKVQVLQAGQMCSPPSWATAPPCTDKHTKRDLFHHRKIISGHSILPHIRVYWNSDEANPSLFVFAVLCREWNDSLQCYRLFSSLAWSLQIRWPSCKHQPTPCICLDFIFIALLYRQLFYHFYHFFVF